MANIHLRRQLPQQIKHAQQKAKLLEDENAQVEVNLIRSDPILSVYITSAYASAAFHVCRQRSRKRGLKRYEIDKENKLRLLKKLLIVIISLISYIVFVCFKQL